MKKKLLIVLTSMAVLNFIGCQNTAVKEKEVQKSHRKEAAKEEEKVYVKESEMGELFKNPQKYKGKYVAMHGKIFQKLYLDGVLYYDTWFDIKNYKQEFIIKVTGDDLANTDDYIKIDGKIITPSTFLYPNLPSRPNILLVEADKIETESYIDAVVPTLSSIVPPDAHMEQKGISIKVDKVEFAKDETRVYVTITNNSGFKYNFFEYASKILQKGRQIELDPGISSYEGKYPRISSEILDKITNSGILVFPPIDSSMDFELYCYGMIEQYDFDIEPFQIEIKVEKPKSA